MVHRKSSSGAAMKALSCSFLLAGIVSILFSVSLASTWYIKPDGTGGAPTIQAGIDSAAAGDTVLLANGSYTGTGNWEINYNGKAVTVRSESGDPNACVIDCAAGSPVFRRAFYFASAETLTSVLEGVTITNCDENNGGAISCISSSPHIINCIFLDNDATYGGAMYIGGGGPILEDCVFSGGWAVGDGALTLGNASPILIRCTFVNNTGFAESAGAMWVNSNSSASFEDCLFIDNSNPCCAGGAVAIVDNSFASFTNCLFYGNSAASGGAVYVGSNCIISITSCSFYENSATSGGAIKVGANSTVSIERTIIAFSTSGEAVLCSGVVPNVILNCSNIYGNAGGDYVSCFVGQDTISGNFSSNPLFCDTANADFALAALSDCLPQNNSCGVLIGAYGQGCDAPVGIESLDAMKSSLLLMQNYTNPFNPSTTIPFVIDMEGHVSLVICDISGARIRTLVNREIPPGFYIEEWNGRNANGNSVASGVYFYRLAAGNRTLTKKMLLLK
jgi:hypothetical protein